MTTTNHVADVENDLRIASAEKERNVALFSIAWCAGRIWQLHELGYADDESYNRIRTEILEEFGRRTNQ